MRTKLGNRRPSENMKVLYVGDNGHPWKLLVTLGFDREGRVREVFCSSFKVGTSLNAIVMDACILLSRLLQNGESPAEIAASMCEPPSLVGTIAAAIAKRVADDGGLSADSPRIPSAPVGDGAMLAHAE
jgi:hypothetical protein